MFKCDLNDNKLPSKIYPRGNLLAAFDKVRSNKGGKTSGIDGISVKGFKEHLEEHLCQLHEELKSGNYKPQAIKRVYIEKEDGSKRPLGIPTIRDRVVQQALLNVLQPIFDPDFHPSSYGYRPNRSAHHTVAKAERFTRHYGLNQVVDMDLSKCFDTLDNDLILSAVNEKVSDGKVLNLIFLLADCLFRWATSFREKNTELRKINGKYYLYSELKNYKLHYIIPLYRNNSLIDYSILLKANYKKEIENFIRNILQQRLKLSGQRWTKKGIQEITNLRILYETGENYSIISPVNNTEAMNVFLNEVSSAFQNYRIIMCLDGAGWHTSHSLKLPQNIQLLKLPPYSPELNPTEHIWDYIREQKQFNNYTFKTLDDVEDKLSKALKELNNEHEILQSLCGFNWL